MSNNNLAGFPSFGPRIDTKITYNPVAYIPESPITLPTTLPDTAQVQFTVNAASLPTFSPLYPILHQTDFSFSEKYVCYFVLGFYNAGASADTITAYYKSANPATFSYGTGASIGAGKYKVLCTRQGLNIPALNDIQEYKLFAPGGNVSLVWAYMVVCPGYLMKMGDDQYQHSIAGLEIDISHASWIGAASVATPTTGWHCWLLETRGGDKNGMSSYAIANVRQGAYQCPWQGYLMRAPNASSSQNVIWAADQITDNKTHMQPYYPVRIAYTPIL